MNTYLTAGQRAMMQAALQQRKHELERQLDEQLGGRSRFEHAHEVLQQDGDDAPARDADREVDLARSDQDIGELRAVNDALKRLEGPAYGLCVDCGKEIPFDRLQHSPQAMRCVACQEKLEARRHTGHRNTL